MQFEARGRLLTVTELKRTLKVLKPNAFIWGMGRQRLRLEVSGRARITQIHTLVNTQAVTPSREGRWMAHSLASEALASPPDCKPGLNFILVWLFIKFFPCAHPAKHQAPLISRQEMS